MVCRSCAIFALLVSALDWNELSDEERRRVAEPVGEDRLADDGGRLKVKIEEWRSEFRARVGSCPDLILDYVTTAVTALNTAATRMSPRRSRLLAQPAGGDHRRWRTFEPPVQARPWVQPSPRRVGRATPDTQ